LGYFEYNIAAGASHAAGAAPRCALPRRSAPCACQRRRARLLQA
jgi:hypothetical protein